MNFLGPTLFVGMALLQKFLLKGNEGATY